MGDNYSKKAIELLRIIDDPGKILLAIAEIRPSAVVHAYELIMPKKTELELLTDKVGILVNNGKRIVAIKEVRSILGLGLREARDFVEERFPSTLK